MGQDLVLFDLRHHPQLAALKGKTILLAYVSIGETAGDAEEKALLENKGLILAENPTWGSHVVDITEETWKNIVLARVREAERQGFDGVMLDTVDSPFYWAKTKHPSRERDFKHAAIALIQEIRTNHPTMKIMLNRGFEILPSVAQQIDYVLAESILLESNDSAGQISSFLPKTYADIASKLQQTVYATPHLRVFTLDYWNPDDVHGLARIYAIQRAHGFIPYVTTRDLTHFTPEPLFPPHAAN